MRKLEFQAMENTDGKVVAYLHDTLTEMPSYREAYPTVVVLPGGGYNFCSMREADPVALEYLSAGYNVFVLYYSVKENAKNFTPLKEVSSLIMSIRENQKEWNCDPDKIAVCGFSAGGHLATSIATMWNSPDLLSDFDNKNGLNKPNGAILGYAVITADPKHSHQGSIDNVSADRDTAVFSLENQVNSDTCPCFIWHTVEDPVVPVENAILMMQKLQQHKVSFEAHIFPTGGHGISVCTQEVNTEHSHNRQWVQLSKNWLNLLFDYKK